MPYMVWPLDASPAISLLQPYRLLLFSSNTLSKLLPYDLGICHSHTWNVLLAAQLSPHSLFSSLYSTIAASERTSLNTLSKLAFPGILHLFTLFYFYSWNPLLLDNLLQPLCLFADYLSLWLGYKLCGSRDFVLFTTVSPALKTIPDHGERVVRICWMHEWTNKWLKCHPVIVDQGTWVESWLQRREKGIWDH